METAKICLEDLRVALGAVESKWKPDANETEEAKEEHDAVIIKDTMRASVQEELRKEVDSEMRALLHQLKVWRPMGLILLKDTLSGKISSSFPYTVQ